MGINPNTGNDPMRNAAFSTKFMANEQDKTSSYISDKKRKFGIFLIVLLILALASIFLLFIFL